MAKESDLLLAKSTQTMETNIQIFTSEVFGKIRTCQVNNQIMFVGKDVATALGYSDPQKAIRVHVDDEDKGGAILSTPGGSQRVIVINESGLYSLILSSKLEHSHRSDGPRPGAPAHACLLFTEGREEGTHLHDLDDERSALPER